ncbi:ABC transporter ATP-binding protein [Tomitella fengzijianii]|uniref:ABC transporter ATP-binding protein n=1 Tax=Tomitella fengzijianii TaxID=2597660 RepID=A0A516X6F9_9ACTN|nr:ABC transporter ATP-binding protein [Tomitella fengzijianii]QDQ98662.1 ABC transporter ATP-binding protein [Tomitella fengzijianii]
MTTAISVAGLGKTYRDVTALDGVSFAIQENTICGVLGRNGAGKTTAMQIITGHAKPSSGSVDVFGRAPFEDRDAMSSMCFVKESQRYPDEFKVKHVLASAADLLPQWDQGFADDLLGKFDLPTGRRVKKLSRGMHSMLGIIIGLASRAPVTLFDEPYLGLDVVARQMFYDELLADYAAHPRTIVLSTHLVDEVANLLEHVVLIDGGRVLIDDCAENLRRRAVVATGGTAHIDDLAAGRTELRRETLGTQARVTLQGDFTDDDLARARERGVDIAPASLQQLMIGATGTEGRQAS